MGLETGTVLDDLEPLNPTNTDGVNEADDHIRLIKDILKNTFGGNPTPGEFTTLLFKLTQGINIPTGGTAEINTPITKNGGVAVGGMVVNGGSGTILGGNFGFTQARKIGTGDYEVFIPTSLVIPENAIFTITPFYGFTFGLGTVGENFSASGNGWYRVVTASTDTAGNQTIADCVSFGISVLNADGFT